MPEFIDLSQEVYSGHPNHSFFPDTHVWTDISYEEGEEILSEMLGVDDPGITFTTKLLLMSDHGPTHVDALSHFTVGGPTIDEMPLDLFYGPGKAIEVTHYDDESDDVITIEDIEAACDEAGVSLNADDILLINTGHYEATYPDEAYEEHYVGLTADAMQWLVDQGIRNVGVDSPGIDNSNDMNFPAHRVCRDNEVTHMENLCNIEKVVGEDFTFSGFPLKIQGGSGGPMRAVAILE